MGMFGGCFRLSVGVPSACESKREKGSESRRKRTETTTEFGDTIKRGEMQMRSLRDIGIEEDR